jgi:hypothetical protein
MRLWTACKPSLAVKGSKWLRYRWTRAGIRPVLRFFEELAITTSRRTSMIAVRACTIWVPLGLPTSLYHAEGQEVAPPDRSCRMDSPEVLTFLKGRIAD